MFIDVLALRVLVLGMDAGDEVVRRVVARKNSEIEKNEAQNNFV